MQLTPEQQAVLDCVKNTQDNIVVQALAGSGKTSILVEIAKRLPRRGKHLAIAFNKNIATELSDRLPEHVQAQTINSLGHRAWMRHLGRRITIDKDKIGNIIKEYYEEASVLGDQFSTVIQAVRLAKAYGIVPANAPGKFKAIIDNPREALADIINRLEMDTESLGGNSEAISFIESILNTNIELAFDGELDFDDQVYMPALWRCSLDKFDTILWDEIQDGSPVQHAFVAKMMDDSSRFIGCGDEKQAIYNFRGSDSNSMRKAIKEYDCVELPLTVCFRCPKSIIKQAQQYVPSIQYHDGAEEGEVLHLSRWGAKDIDPGSTVLCRNVAPLVRMTYRLISSGVPAAMYGKDIGKSITSLIKKVSKSKNPVQSVAFFEKLTQWREREVSLAKAKNKPEQEELVLDKYATIEALQEFSSAQDTRGLINAVESLFSDSAGGKVLLSTIHKVKGQEYDTVYFLDKWRIPSKYAKKIAKTNPNAPEVQQETNLLYVGITRARKKLVYLDSNNYEETAVGEKDVIKAGIKSKVESNSNRDYGYRVSS